MRIQTRLFPFLIILAAALLQAQNPAQEATSTPVQATTTITALQARVLAAAGLSENEVELACNQDWEYYICREDGRPAVAEIDDGHPTRTRSFYCLDWFCDRESALERLVRRMRGGELRNARIKRAEWDRLLEKAAALEARNPSELIKILKEEKR